MITFFDFDVDGVLVLRQHIPSVTFTQEEDALDVVSFEKDVLVLGKAERFEQRTDPRDERSVLALKELDGLVPLFVDVEHELRFEVVGQLLQEVLNLDIVSADSVILEMPLAL